MKIRCAISEYSVVRVGSVYWKQFLYGTTLAPFEMPYLIVQVCYPRLETLYLGPLSLPNFFLLMQDPCCAHQGLWTSHCTGLQQSMVLTVVLLVEKQANPCRYALKCND